MLHYLLVKGLWPSSPLYKTHGTTLMSPKQSGIERSTLYKTPEPVGICCVRVVPPTLGISWQICKYHRPSHWMGSALHGQSSYAPFVSLSDCWSRTRSCGFWFCSRSLTCRHYFLDNAHGQHNRDGVIGSSSIDWSGIRVDLRGNRGNE